jgi:hypothetical protein
VATNGKDKEIQCRYVGKHEQSESRNIESKPVAPKAEFAQTVALSVLGSRIGRYHPTDHFNKRRVEREFDVFDMEYAIRNGTCVGAGEFCEKYRNFKYRFRTNIEGTDFDAVFALCADHDFIRSPLLILITGCFKTESGKRTRSI